MGNIIRSGDIKYDLMKDANDWIWIVPLREENGNVFIPLHGWSKHWQSTRSNSKQDISFNLHSHQARCTVQRVDGILHIHNPTEPDLSYMEPKPLIVAPSIEDMLIDACLWLGLILPSRFEFDLRSQRKETLAETLKKRRGPALLN